MRWANMSLLLLLWLASFLLILWRGGSSAWFLGVSLGMLIVVCAATALFAGSVEMLRDSADRQLVAGEPADMELTLVRRSSFPLPWLLLEESWRHSPEAPGILVRSVIFPWFRRSMKVAFTVRPERRGIFRSERIHWTAGDPLGLFGVRKAALSPGTLTVLPKPDLTVGPRLMLSGAVEGTAARRAVFGLPRASAAASVRDYSPGDPMRHIHWRSSARSGHLKSREWEAGFAAGWMVLLDAGPDWKGGREPFERAVSAAAGLLQFAEEAGIPSGLAGSGLRPILELPHGQAGLARLLVRLAEVSADGTRAFPVWLGEQNARLPRAAAFLCVTGAFTESLVASLRGLARNGRHAVLLHVRDGQAKDGIHARLVLKLEEAGCAYVPLDPPGMPGTKGGSSHVYSPA